MKIGGSILICVLVVALRVMPAFALGSIIEIGKIEVRPGGSSYTGLGQQTKEARFLAQDTAFISYRINGKDRRLYDDDGLATLYIYHRAIAGKKFANEASMESPLPRPLDPLMDSLNRLEKAYASVELSKVNDPNMFVATVKRVRSVKEKMRKARTYQDFKDSDLESLINDLLPNHTYSLEAGEGWNVRKKLPELIGVGSASSFSVTSAPRCRDQIKLDWGSAVKKAIDQMSDDQREGERSEGGETAI